MIERVTKSAAMLALGPLAAAWLLVGASGTEAAAPVAQRQAGAKPGLWYWTLPDTPNGLKPNQSWSGAGAVPNGDIYVGGMNHVDNAALYRLAAKGSNASRPALTLTYVGDAKAASQAAGNWETGEPIEKFHTQPLALNGQVYVANLNYSLLDATYLSRRGFHWYGYDPAAGKLTDLSASEPDGVGALHGGLVTIVGDPARNVIYGFMAPTGDLYRYDVAAKTTTKLGRPDYQRDYVYAGRAAWLDGNGRVYFTAGNNNGAQTGSPYDTTLFNHVRYYDPATGFGEETGWKLHDQRAIDAAQCFGAPVTCYLMDNVGHVYRYRDKPNGADEWAYLGSIGQKQSELYGLTWVFHVRPDQRKAYIVSRNAAFFEFDLATGKAKLIGNLYKLEPALKNHDFYGPPAWDGKGRFYFAAFPKQFAKAGNTKLVAIDPVKFVAAARK